MQLYMDVAIYGCSYLWSGVTDCRHDTHELYIHTVATVRTCYDL